MRTKKQVRQGKRDDIFRGMITSGYLLFLNIGVELEPCFIENEDEEYEDEDEEYEDELLTLQRQAGFHFDDDGECVYEDD